MRFKYSTWTNRVKSNIQLPNTYRHLSIPEGIRSAMSRNPSKIAYKHGDKKRTYKDLVQRMDRISSGLLHHLNPSEDHLAIVASNSIEYMEIVLGASQAGIPIATVNPKLSDKEIQAICDDAEAKILFVDKASYRTLEHVVFLTVEKIVVIENELEDWIINSKPATEAPIVMEWDVFTMPYTSGTTGKPKGVLVPHRSRILTLFGMAVEYGCYSPDDRFLAIAPMCHGAGMIFSLAPIFFGGYAEIMDSFEPEVVLKTMKNDNITGFFGVPTHFHGILNLGQSILNNAKSHQLKSIISNAAALPQQVKERIIEQFGEGLLHETYGSTEGGIISNLRPDDQLKKLQCVGQAFPCTEIKILTESGNICEPNEVGELFSTSPYLFNGYWKRPDETKEALVDGWLTVGDMARQDEDGYLYIVDRKKDMVISGGVNIYPREIEDVLHNHPNIQDVAVIGVPDEKWGESLKAFIVTHHPDALKSEEVLSFCEQNISKIKTPKIIEFIDTIPRNANGKVLKTTLRKNS